MSVEAKKLNVIERLILIRRESTLDRVVELLEQEEMQARTEESLQAIEQGETMTMTEFRNRSKQWFQNQPTR